MSDNQQVALEKVYNYVMSRSDEKFDFVYCGKTNQRGWLTMYPDNYLTPDSVNAIMREG